MSSIQLVQLELDLDATQAAEMLGKDTTAPKEYQQALINLLSGISGGQYNAHMSSTIGAVYASVVGTFTGLPTATETVTIAGVSLEAVASGATGNQFNIGANAAATAANLAALINSTSDLANIVTATAVGGAVTIRAAVPGAIGNGIVVADSLSNFTFAGSATALSGGSVSSVTDYAAGRAKA